MGDVYMIMHVYEIHPEFGRAVSDAVRVFRHNGVDPVKFRISFGRTATG
jgi:hypothetical protein